MTRSTPAKRENGPLCAIVATLTRQSKCSMSAPGGQQTSSRVAPPPFFHGVAGTWPRSRLLHGRSYFTIGSLRPCFFAVSTASS